MTIAKGQKITYHDLISQVISKIESVCQNVGSFRGVPSAMQHGATNYSASGGNGQKFYVKVNDALMNPNNAVPLGDATSPANGTVRKQLRDFLTERGIDVKNNKVITARDLLNFYQNIAIFLDVKIVQVRSLFSDSCLIFYYKDGNLSTNTSPPKAANIGTDTPGNKI